MYTLDPAWSPCGLGMKGLSDPPYLLTSRPMSDLVTETRARPLPVAGQTISAETRFIHGNDSGSQIEK